MAARPTESFSPRAHDETGCSKREPGLLSEAGRLPFFDKPADSDYI